MAGKKYDFSDFDAPAAPAASAKGYDFSDFEPSPAKAAPPSGRLPSKDGFLATVGEGLAEKWQGIKDLPRDASNLASSVGQEIPIVGPAVQNVSERLGALAAALTPGQPGYSEALQIIQDMNDEEHARKLAESPLSVGVAAPIMGAVVAGGALKNLSGAAGSGGAVGSIGNTVKSYQTAKGYGGSAARIAGTLGTTAADSALRGKDADQVTDDVKLATYIQTGLELIPRVGKGAARFLGGVSNKNVDYYLENADAVNKAKPLEEIKDLTDNEVGKMRIDTEQAKGAVEAAGAETKRLETALDTAFSNTRDKIKGKISEAKETLKTAWMGRVNELKAKSGVTLEMADDLLGRMNAQKAVLGALSEDAEFALAKTGGTVDKAHLLEMVDEIGGSVGVGKGKALIGEEAEGAVAAFMKTRTKIADALPDKIPYEDLRGVMRQLRADIQGAGGFGQKAGEFSNNTLTNMKKELTGSISDFLKGPQGSEGYKKAMEKMAPKSKVLQEMSDNFGDQPQALASLQALVNASSPKAKYLRDLLKRFGDETGNTDLLTRLEELENAKGVLGDPLKRQEMMQAMPEYRDLQRAEGALAQFDPKRTGAATQAMLDASPQTAQLMSAEQKLLASQDAGKRFAGWSPQSSESRLKSVMGGRSIENARALAELKEISGIDFTKMLDDRRVADAFDKGFMHGSRNVNLWSMVGSLFGGTAANKEGRPLMKLFGIGFGAHVDSAGPKMTKAALDAFLTFKNSRFAPILEQASTSGLGPLTATHLQLQQTDPQYAAMVENMRKDAKNEKSPDVAKSFDPELVASERARLQDAEDMPSTERAKALTTLNKNGYVELPEPEAPEIDMEQLPPDVDVDDLMQALESAQ